MTLLVGLLRTTVKGDVIIFLKRPLYAVFGVSGMVFIETSNTCSFIEKFFQI
jgi:hypothetical protein